jgi:putative ABC transport system permease protein
MGEGRMSRVPMWRRYLRFLGPDVRADVEDELRFHLEMRTQELIARGLEPEAARAEAERRFGDPERVRRECEREGREREGSRRRRERLDALRQDVRYAARSLRREPGFAGLATLTLALAIGVATAMFSVVNGVLLRPLPVADQERVMVMWGEQPARDFPHMPMLHPMLEEYREGNRAFEMLAGIDYNGAWPRAMQDGDVTVSIAGTWVTGDFFRVLGVVPALGRILLPDDDIVGAAPAMVISHAFWQRHFGGDASAIGREFRWNERNFMVVGVMPRGFEYPRGAEFWTALGPIRSEVMETHLDLVGRLRPGVTVEGARGDLGAFLQRTDAERPPMLQGLRPVVTPLADLVVGEVRAALWILAAAVLLLVLIACGNVANLLLIRGSVRVRELAIRSALGADRRRIARQLLTESAVLAAVAGVAGTGIALIALRGLVALAPPQLPRLEAVRLDPVALGFALAATLLVGLLAGLAPALWSAAGDANATLRGGARVGAGTAGVRRVRQGLVAGQVALALLVLVGAGLLLRSLANLQRAEMGFSGEGLVVATMSLPPGRFTERAEHLALLDRVVERVAALPGVGATSPVTRPPFSGKGGWDAPYTGEGQATEAREANPVLNLELAGPAYFEVLGVPILQGRAFSERDREDAAPVAIVSEAVARRTWPGEDPLGKRVKLGGPDSPMPWHTVVGVAAETRYRELVEPRPSIYIPIRQFGGPVPMSLGVRTEVDPAAVIPALRSALREVEPGLLLVEAMPLARLLDAPLAGPRFSAALLGVFATLALVLASVGIYGVMAAWVRQRQHEIGVRMALGAAAPDIRRLVLGQGLLLALAGAGIGVVAALAGTRLLAALLFGVSPTDPLTFAGVASVLLLVALAACYLPARRAARVDPMTSLRAE